MAVVRSPYAHAKITKVDVSKALAADGVVAAFTGAELAGEWAGSLPCAWPVTGDCHIPQHHPLTADKARYAGDGVAAVEVEHADVELRLREEQSTSARFAVEATAGVFPRPAAG